MIKMKKCICGKWTRETVKAIDLNNMKNVRVKRNFCPYCGNIMIM